MPSTTPASAPKSLSEALSALQAQLPHVAKEHRASVTSQRTGKTHTYDYADLLDVTEAIMPLMASLGLSFTCCPTYDDSDRFVLSYRLAHVTDTGFVGGRYPLPAGGTPQEIGSAITYARRYALCAVTGLAPGGDDDDAAANLRPADRSNNPADAAPWTDQPAGDWQPVTPEDKPGSSNAKQHQQLGILYSQLGITERDTRLAEMTDRVGRVITSAKDLSYAEADAALKELRALAEAAKAEMRGRT
jgi:hypothetical protein